MSATEWCYTPIIQSGGKYDLRPSAVSDESPLHDGTIVCSLGVRYKSYCSNISRTFLVNPEKVFSIMYFHRSVTKQIELGQGKKL
jgi:nucleosome binding factor SPN SPT16 subunit